VEVEAGTLDLSKCTCTLKPYRRTPVGIEYTLFAIAKDTLGNYLSGGRHHCKVEVDPGQQCVVKVEDIENGTSKISLVFKQTGRHIVKVLLSADGAQFEVLAQAPIDATPGPPKASKFEAKWVVCPWAETLPPLVAMAGVPWAIDLVLRDQFGNMTTEQPALALEMVGAQTDVKPQLELPTVTPPASDTAPWTAPPPAECTARVRGELQIAGDYELKWTTQAAQTPEGQGVDDSGTFKFTVVHGPADPVHCSVTGTHSGVFYAPITTREINVLLFDEFMNPVVDGGMLTLSWGPAGGPHAPVRFARNKHLVVAHVAVDKHGDWELETKVNSTAVLGSPFVVGFVEDPAAVAAREAERARAQAELDQQREVEERRQAQERRQRREEEEKSKAAAAAAVPAPTDDEVIEMEERRRAHERVKKEEATRQRAAEALKKYREELARQRRAPKARRTGGGFSVPFQPVPRAKEE